MKYKYKGNLYPICKATLFCMILSLGKYEVKDGRKGGWYDPMFGEVRKIPIKKKRPNPFSSACHVIEGFPFREVCGTLDGELDLLDAREPPIGVLNGVRRQFLPMWGNGDGR